eukprot:1729678-Amphidinium_carterae.1
MATNLTMGVRKVAQSTLGERYRWTPAKEHVWTPAPKQEQCTRKALTPLYKVSKTKKTAKAAEGASTIIALPLDTAACAAMTKPEKNTSHASSHHSDAFSKTCGVPRPWPRPKASSASSSSHLRLQM